MTTPIKPTPDNLPRVVSGGSWNVSLVPSWVRAASRGSDVPAFHDYYIGFRCALRGREPRT